MCSGVGAVDVVRLVDGEGVGRGVVDWNSVSWDLVNWGSVGWDVLVSWHGVGRLVVDRGSVGRLDMVVVARVLRRGGASFVRPRVGREPCRVGEVLRLSKLCLSEASHFVSVLGQGTTLIVCVRNHTSTHLAGGGEVVDVCIIVHHLYVFDFESVFVCFSFVCESVFVCVSKTTDLTGRGEVVDVAPASSSRVH